MARMLIICIRLLTPKRLIKLKIRWLPSYLDFGQSGIPGNKVDADKADILSEVTICTLLLFFFITGALIGYGYP